MFRTIFMSEKNEWDLDVLVPHLVWVTHPALTHPCRCFELVHTQVSCLAKHLRAVQTEKDVECQECVGVLCNVNRRSLETLSDR